MSRARKSSPLMARRYYVQGRVQGVGYRYFVQRVAGELGITGYTRNLEDGRVEVFAAGTEEQLSDLAGYLRKGPRLSDVHAIEEMEAPVLQYSGFHIEYFS